VGAIIFHFVGAQKTGFLLEIRESIPIERISVSPRTLRVSMGDIGELASSIQQMGLIQPILIRPTGDDMYELVAGSRRLSACKLLRLSSVPCIIRPLSDKEAFEISLIENVQRHTLDPVEEAEAFRKYVQEYGYGGISELSKRIGKSQEYVSHRILLLKLPEEILSKVSSRELSSSSARELVWLKDKSRQLEMATEIGDRSISVKKIHAAVMVAKCGISPKKAIETVLNENSEPEFLIGNAPDKQDEYTKAIDKLIVILRVAMLRVDSMVEGAATAETQKMLIRKRYAIHQLIDDSIREKIASVREARSK